MPTSGTDTPYNPSTGAGAVAGSRNLPGATTLGNRKGSRKSSRSTRKSGRK